ncbi:MAG: hypothetical protein ACK5PT_15480 [Cereibacter sp.]
MLVGRDQEVAIAWLDDSVEADCQEKEEPNDKPKTEQQHNQSCSDEDFCDEIEQQPHQ